MTDVLTKAKRSWNMSRVHGKGTGPEKAVQRILRRIGAPFSMYADDLPGCPDFVIRSQQAAVFVHGCFWHQHNGCRRASLPRSNRRFWIKKLAANACRDRRNARLLRAKGWRVATVWQCQLRKPDAVENRLRRYLEAAKETVMRHGRGGEDRRGRRCRG